MHTEILQPAPQNRSIHFDKWQHGGQEEYPVHAHKTPEGWVSTGISFEDYTRMNIRVKRPSNERRLLPPEWAMDDGKLLELVATQMEFRAHDFTAAKDAKERLAHAQAALEVKRPIFEAQLDRLCAEYAHIKKVAPGNGRRLLRLRTQIQNIDTTLLILNRTAGIMIAIVYLYWRARYDSVGVAEELGIRPPHVRTLLCRLGQSWKRMQSPSFARWRDARIKSEHVYGGYQGKKPKRPEMVFRPVPVVVNCKLASEPRSLIQWKNEEVWIENERLVHTGWRTGILQAVQTPTGRLMLAVS